MFFHHWSMRIKRAKTLCYALAPLRIFVTRKRLLHIQLHIRHLWPSLSMSKQSNTPGEQQYQRPNTHPAIVSSVITFSLSQGVLLNEIERIIEMPLSTITSEEARIPDDILSNLWCLLEQKFPNRALGFEMAMAAPFSITAGLAHGMSFAKTYREALTLLCRNKALLADRLNFELVESGDVAEFYYSHPNDLIEHGHMSEFAVVMLLRVAQDIMGEPLKPDEVHFLHNNTHRRINYEAHLGAPVYFGKTNNKVCFDKTYLDKPLLQANADIFSYVETGFSQQLAKISRSEYSNELSQLVEAVVENAALGEFSAQAAAARVNLSLRAAQRLASSYDKTLKSIIDEIRIDIAKGSLKTTTLDMESIGSLAGYSDERAFRRAFKRITSLSPAEYRNNFR